MFLLPNSAMAWHPKKAELAIIDNTGHWGVVSDLVDAKMSEKNNVTTKVATSNNVTKSSTSNVVPKPTKTNDADDDDEMLDDEEVMSKILITIILGVLRSRLLFTTFQLNRR